MLYAQIITKKVKIEGQKVDGYYLNLFGLQFEGAEGHEIYDDYMQLVDSPEKYEDALIEHEIYSFLAKHEFIPISEIFFYRK